MEVYEQRVQALQDTLAKQTAHLASLEDRLDMTLKQAQDLAFRAIESRSHATSFEAIRELAMEQVKGKQKTTSSDEFFVQLESQPGRAGEEKPGPSLRRGRHIETAAVRKGCLG